MAEFFRDRAEAEAEVRRMRGWNNIRVVEEDGEVGLDGEYYPTVYIMATDPVSGRLAVFDGADPYARWV